MDGFSGWKSVVRAAEYKQANGIAPSIACLYPDFKMDEGHTQSHPVPSPSKSSPSQSARPCPHWRATDLALRRYRAGLKFGRRVKRGEITKQDEGDDADDQYDRKRRRVSENLHI